MTATTERNTTARTIAPAAGTETTRQRAARYVWAGTRIALGWIFLWAFLDKLFGLGHETATKDAWINGGSPTKGFLGLRREGSVPGALPGHRRRGLGRLAVHDRPARHRGRPAARHRRCGSPQPPVRLLMVLMWTAVLPPENNPFMDDHLIYAAVLAGLALVGAGNTLGLGRVWATLPLVRRFGWLR